MIPILTPVGVGEFGESKFELLHTLDRSSKPQENNASFEPSNLAGLWPKLKQKLFHKQIFFMHSPYKNKIQILLFLMQSFRGLFYLRA